MNKLKKLLGLSVVLALAALNLNAGTLTLTTTGAATNSILATNGAVIYTIRLQGVTGTTVKFGILDAPSSSVNYTGPGFTNYYFTSGYVTNIYTNIVGTIETNYYPAQLYNTNNVTGPTTNSYPQVILISGVTNQTVVLSPVNPYKVFQGIFVTNNGAGSISIDYAPIR